MKHSPILFRKYYGKVRKGGREVIGIMGIRHGVGVTYTALMLAFYMGEVLGKRTALLECNKHKDFSIIQEAYNWSKEENNTFSFHEITCYKELTLGQVAEVCGDQYDSIIIDFGIDIKACRNEFLRCTTKIIMTGSSEWDRIKLQLFVNETDILRGSSSWLYFIPHADVNTVSELSSIIKRKVYSVPRMADPTMPTRHSIKFFSHIF